MSYYSGIGNGAHRNDDIESVEAGNNHATNNQTADRRHAAKTALSRKSRSVLRPAVAERVDELEDIDKSLLFRQLRSLFACMRIFGIYFKHQSKENGRRGLMFLCNYCSPRHLYCLFVNAILLFHFAWSLAAFRVRLGISAFVKCILCILITYRISEGGNVIASVRLFVRLPSVRASVRFHCIF